MEQSELEELWQRKKAQTIRLMEVSDLTRQLSQALGRRDQVSISVLLSMREEPLQRLREMEESLRAYLLRLPEASAIRAQELLSGGAAASGQERELAEQVAQYRNLLDTVVDMDRQLSLRLGGNRSFYKMFR